MRARTSRGEPPASHWRHEVEAGSAVGLLAGDSGGVATSGTDTAGTDTAGIDRAGTDPAGTDTPGSDTPGSDASGARAAVARELGRFAVLAFSTTALSFDRTRRSGGLGSVMVDR
jgi:hypothetical protein